jgi:hypothetical protein
MIVLMGVVDLLEKSFVLSTGTNIEALTEDAGACKGHKSLLVLFFRKEHACFPQAFSQ